MSKSAIFTIQHDEDFFLPIWIKYYTQHFDPKDIYIVAHNCSDLTKGILDDAIAQGINVERIDTNEIFNHEWLNSIVHAKQKELLNKYEYVVFTDCDELIVPTKQSLKEFLQNADADAYRCVGFNVIIDGTYRDTMYDKTLISKVPLQYVYGYHTATPHFDALNTLHLYHLHKLDYQQAWDRKIRLSKETWDQVAIDRQMSIQNQLVDKKDFDKFFFVGYDNRELFKEPLKSIIDFIR